MNEKISKTPAKMGAIFCDFGKSKPVFELGSTRFFPVVFSHLSARCLAIAAHALSAYERF